jgi:hypothetical protein
MEAAHELLVAPTEAGAAEREGLELSGVSASNPGQNRTVCAKPARQRAHGTRTGREPQNPRITKNPLTPLKGSHQLVSIVEDYFTLRGRHCHRTVTVDLDEIRSQLPPPARPITWPVAELDSRSTSLQA